MPAAAFFKRVRDQFTWPIAAFWLISLTPFFIENGPQLTHAFSSKCHVETERYGSLYESVRRWVRKRDPFSQSPDNVVLVTYSSYEGRYIMANFCAARAFTAMVLERIAKASPAAIAVDWTNNPGTCPPNDRGTLLLKESVRRVLNGQVADPKGRKYPAVPIVTARRTWIKSELEAENRTHATGIDPAALHDDEQVGRPDVLDDSGVAFGLIRLNCECDRIPTRWNFYPDAGEIGKSPHPADSLSVVTMLNANRGKALRQQRLQQSIQQHSNPYVSLYGEDDFVTVHALDLVCGKPLPPDATFETCKADQGKPDELQKLRGGKIVLLADMSSREDFHITPLGELPGAILHANYIEALIGGWYTKPVSIFAQLIVSLVWFAAIEAVFAHFTHKPLYALLSSLAIIFFIMFLVFVLVERVLAWHIVLLPPSLLLIFIRTCYALGERQALRTISSGNI